MLVLLEWEEDASEFDSVSVSPFPIKSLVLAGGLRMVEGPPVLTRGP